MSTVFKIEVTKEELSMLMSAVTTCSSDSFQKGEAESYTNWQKLRGKIRQSIILGGEDYEEKHPIFNV